MTLANLIKDFIDNTNERIKTPISGAFLWSFIIYNWRPIFLLLFSEASIENKIIVINHEYCNFWAIFFPFFIALFYTILIPKLMLNIDNSLTETKRDRVNNIYDAKEHLMVRKIDIARQDFLLKNVESGSKQVEELLNKIKNLEETHEQITNADKNIITNLNDKLKQANQTISEIIEVRNSGNIKDNEFKRILDFEVNASDAFDNLTEEDKSDFLKLRGSDDKINLSNVTDDRANKYVHLELVQKDKYNNWLISDRGIYVYNRIIKQKKI